MNGSLRHRIDMRSPLSRNSKLFPALALLWAGSGCGGILNSSFVDTLSFVEDNSIIANSTLQNAPGHVALLFINNTTFDPDLLAYLERVQPGTIPTSTSGLRPRVRLTAQVTFIDGNSLVMEFIDGAEIFQGTVRIGDPDFDLPDLVLPTDLQDSELSNAVFLCDVASISIIYPVDIYVPVALKEVTVEEAGQGGEPTRQLNSITQPSFVPLQVDTVDADLSVVTPRNFDIRDVPGPVGNLQCGSVAAIIMSGVLDVPFVVDELAEIAPGFLDTDDLSQAASPGRFRLVMQLQ